MTDNIVFEAEPDAQGRYRVEVWDGEMWLLCSLSAIGGFTLAALLVAASQTDQLNLTVTPAVNHT